MADKTLVMKLLEKKKVAYSIHPYPSTERDAEKIAEIFGVSGRDVFKTLVVVRTTPKSKPLLVMVPADSQLDLKRLANAVGDKKLKMAKHEEAEALTGLQVGGISPLALLNKGFQFVLDESADSLEAIFISAGKRGINLKVPVAAIKSFTGAKTADIKRQ